MKVLYILTAVALLLFLLARLRVGAAVEFSETGLSVKVRVGAFRIPVFPVRNKNKTKEKPAQPKQNKPKGGLLELVEQFLPLVLDTARKFKRRLRVDVLEMELTVAAPDPADAAMQFGQANALLASLWQPVTRVFHVRDGRAHIGIDFDAQKPTLYLLASLSLTVGQLLALGTVFAAKALGILMRTRNKHKSIQRKAV